MPPHAPLKALASDEQKVVTCAVGPFNSFLGGVAVLNNQLVAENILVQSFGAAITECLSQQMTNLSRPGGGVREFGMRVSHVDAPSKMAPKVQNEKGSRECDPLAPLIPQQPRATREVVATLERIAQERGNPAAWLFRQVPAQPFSLLIPP